MYKPPLKLEPERRAPRCVGWHVGGHALSPVSRAACVAKPPNGAPWGQVLPCPLATGSVYGEQSSHWGGVWRSVGGGVTGKGISLFEQIKVVWLRQSTKKQVLKSCCKGTKWNLLATYVTMFLFIQLISPGACGKTMCHPLLLTSSFSPPPRF